MADLVNQFEVALRNYHEGNGHWSIVDRARQALHEALAATPAADLVCSTDPRAAHGFDRNASHNEGRYVCECESWTPEPALAATPAAEPLTEDALLDGFCKARHSQHYASVFIAGARFAERAHGIGKVKESSNG